MDGWACGLFLMMAMRACAARTGFENAIDNAKEEMRAVVLDALLKIPCAQSSFFSSSIITKHHLSESIDVPISDTDSDGEVVTVEGPEVVAAVAEKSTLLAFRNDIKMAGPSRAVISDIKLGKTSMK
jgi:hypothetical protein